MKPGTHYYRLTPEFRAAVRAADFDHVYKKGGPILTDLHIEMSDGVCAVTATDVRRFRKLASVIGFTGELFIDRIYELTPKVSVLERRCYLCLRQIPDGEGVFWSDLGILVCAGECHERASDERRLCEGSRRGRRPSTASLLLALRCLRNEVFP